MKKLHGTLAVVAITAAITLALAAQSRAASTADVGESVDVPAGPIWNNDDAKTKCPAVCAAAGGTWNGNWKTVIPGRSSVCGCN